jgi:hypothetical protein
MAANGTSGSVQLGGMNSTKSATAFRVAISSCFGPTQAAEGRSAGSRSFSKLKEKEDEDEDEDEREWMKLSQCRKETAL